MAVATRDPLMRTSGLVAKPKRGKAKPAAAYHRPGPTPEFRAQHEVREELVQHDGDTVVANSGVSKAYADRVVDQDTLDYLFRRESLNAEQYRAGRQLHTDWIMAGNEQLKAADAGKIHVDGQSGAKEPNARLAAQDRVRLALRALGGKQAEIAVELCVWGTRLKAMEARLTMSKNAGIDVVRIVLDRLDEHYESARVYR